VACASGAAGEGARYRFYARDLKWGEVGCALSHHAVWEEVARRRLARAIVAEDDVEFTPAFEELLTGALARLDDLVAAGRLAPPDLLYLGRKACWPAREVCVDDPPSGVEVRLRLVRPSFSYKTTAYVLYASGARKLLRSGFLSHLLPLDDFLPALYGRHEPGPGLARADVDALVAGAPRLTAYAVRPLACWERRGLSDTEASEEVAGRT